MVILLLITASILVVCSLTILHSFNSDAASIWHGRHKYLSRLGITLTDVEQPQRQRTLDRPSYKDVFPPQQRQTLHRLLERQPLQQPEGSEYVAIDGHHLQQQSLIGLHEDYQKCSSSRHTCTGISIGEIRALGTFPNYSVLSGVPDPCPYEAFDIRTALPRPYRPLRWAYHQTMCR